MAKSAIAMDTQASVVADAMVAAWQQLQATRILPEKVEVLQEEGARSVFRLHGVGRDGTPVIAKRSDRSTVHHERSVYDEVLPGLQVPHLRSYGVVDEPHSPNAWLFLEDALGEPYSPGLTQHRVLAATWLGCMHARAARLERPPSLRDAGAEKFQPLLGAARATIVEVMSNPVLQARDRSLLRSLAAQLDVVHGHWNELVNFLDRMPQTLVHGDVKADNLRVRTDAVEPAVMAFDWHDGGWGVAALDAAKFLGYSVNPDIETYIDVVSESWPWMDRSLIYRLGYAGELFRSIASIRWEVERLRYDWVETPIQNLNIYTEWLQEIVVSEPWAEEAVNGPQTRVPKPRTWV